MKPLRKAVIIFSAAMAVFTMSAALHAQAKAILPVGTIKTADGFLFFYNTKAKSFMLEIKGKEVTAQQNSGIPMFIIDGKLVQIVTADTKNFVPAGKVLGDDEILELHKKWESDFLSEEQYRGKLQVETEKLSIGDRKTLFWGFKRPSVNENFDRDYFLTTTFGPLLLAVSAPIKPKEDLSAYKALLTEIMSTLKVSSEPYDILKIAEDLRKAPVKND